MNSSTPTSASGTGVRGTRRERQHQATLEEILDVARGLLSAPGGLSLRAIAQEMGMTAPALYRYVGSYQELVTALALDIDRRTTETFLVPAAASQPADDPAARITAAAVAFRRWALEHKEEFDVVFTNTDATPVCADGALQHDSASGALFTELLLQVWQKYQFPIVSLDDLDPALVEVLRDPAMPGDHSEIPDEFRGLIWTFMRSWAALYGTVTLEVFGHLDPRIIASGALFREMFEDQARMLGMTEELPRLRALTAELLAR